jgi:hypothetical protein
MKNTKFRFTSTRNHSPFKKPNQPDYHDIIDLNGIHFTITGWLDAQNSNISWILDKITPERLQKDRFLNRDYFSWKNGSKNGF